MADPGATPGYRTSLGSIKRSGTKVPVSDVIAPSQPLDPCESLPPNTKRCEAVGGFRSESLQCSQVGVVESVHPHKEYENPSATSPCLSLFCLSRPFCSMSTRSIVAPILCRAATPRLLSCSRSGADAATSVQDA
eukprot:898088-Rhodomonas_salina.1